MLIKEILIELFKKNIQNNIRNSGIVSFIVDGNYVSLKGFSLINSIDINAKNSIIGITNNEYTIKHIGFNSIFEEITFEEYTELNEVWRESLKRRDFLLLEELASKSEIDSSRRVLTEKRTGKEQIKF